MISQRTYAGKTVVLTVAVAAVTGFSPIAGLQEDVERIWKKMQAKGANSAAQLDKLARIQNRRASDVSSKLAKFREIDAAAQRAAQTDDVYSSTWKPPKYDKNAPDYGRPREGSLTEQRGIAAGVHVAKEIIRLCEVIDEYGVKNEDGTVTITFGKLFDTYVYISDKVVGILLRARKHGIVSFQGEILYQRRDEQVPVTLMKPLQDVVDMYDQSKDPASCLKSTDTY